MTPLGHDLGNADHGGGLGTGAFGFQQMTGEPLLKELLKRVIQDEARHALRCLASA